jgi:hypothetical protein
MGPEEGYKCKIFGRVIIRLIGNRMVFDMLGVRLPLEMVNTVFSLFTDCLFSFDRRSSPPK